MGGTGRWGEHLASDPLPDELCAHWPALGLWGRGGGPWHIHHTPTGAHSPPPRPPCSVISLLLLSLFPEPNESHSPSPSSPPLYCTFPFALSHTFPSPIFSLGGGGRGTSLPVSPLPKSQQSLQKWESQKEICGERGAGGKKIIIYTKKKEEKKKKRVLLGDEIFISVCAGSANSGLGGTELRPPSTTKVGWLGVR